jgi:hypothetical protein
MSDECQVDAHVLVQGRDKKLNRASARQEFGSVKSGASYRVRRSLKTEGLPAVAAISAVATISTIAAASTPAATATMSAATATETTATAATAAALLLRPCFIHDQITATEVLAVEGIHRAVCLFVIRNFDESKTARLACKAVANEVDCRRVDT